MCAQLVHCKDQRVMKSEILYNTLLIFIFYAPMVWSGELQRLFTTPEQRHSLDESRFNPPPPPTVQELKTLELPDPPRFITFNGMVHLPQYTTIWVNNSSQLNQQTFQVQPNADATISIILPKTKVTVRLYAGQTFDTINNKILEVYQPVAESNPLTPSNADNGLKNIRAQ